MKIWLPDSLYRIKPLLIILFGAVLLIITDAIVPMILGFICLGYGSWIIVVRLLWSNARMVKSRVGSAMIGEQRTHVVDVTRKKSPK